MTTYKSLIVSAFLARYDQNEMVFIINQFMPLIKKYQRKLGGNEDAKQEMILTIIEAIHSCPFRTKYMNEASFISYLAKSVYYKYVMLYKKANKEPLTYLEDHPEIVLSINDASNISFIESLQQLSPTQRNILYLKYCFCLTDAEIAKKLNITSQGVGQSRRRALAKLRKKIL